MKFKHLLLRFSAGIIDAAIVYAISLLLNFLFIKFWYFEILRVYLWVMLLYLIFSYTWKGQTIAKYFLGIELQTNNGNKPSFITIIKREIIYKYILGLIIPFCVLMIMGYDDFYFNIIYVFIFLIFITSVFWLFTKKTWWDALAKTKFVNTETLGRNRQYLYLLLVVFLVAMFFLIRFANNLNQKSDFKILGFNFPEKFVYPDNSRVTEYVKFLSKPQLNAKDYIFDLFKKNDVVILCERFHPETTQWDFIYDLVSDRRFIVNVGNMFTEYGNHDKQPLVDTFLTTKYRNDTLLNKATANLMHYLGTVSPSWDNSNFFYFLKKLNLLNANLPDTLKIHEYFTNQTSWDFVNNKKQFDSITNIDYDSVMAINVINRYRYIKNNERRKKCLVITNYVHAFNITKGKLHGTDGVAFTSEATYIFKSFPNTTANILFNTMPFKYPLPLLFPIQHGSWDKAFSLIGNKSLGFNFKGSPFGEVEFELNKLYSLGKKNKRYFQDVFSGFIFYKPIEEFKYQTGYPFIMDGFENEFTRRCNIEFGNTNNVKGWIEAEKKRNDDDTSKMKIIINFSNCIDLIFFLLLTFLALLVSTFHVLRISLRK